VRVDMDREARTLAEVLYQHGLAHLRVSKRGTSLTVVSGPEAASEPEVRLVHVPPRRWRLDLRHHAGRWEQTHFVGTMSELIRTAVEIARLGDDSPPPPNRGDTSDPRH
jgi:hypothetical protein